MALRSACLLASAAAVLLPLSALADPQDMGQIVVRGSLEAAAPSSSLATRSTTPLFEAPFAVQAVSGATLEDRGLLSLQDALRSVPGTAPVVGIGNFNSRFRLRGFVATSNLRNGGRQGLGFAITELANVDQIDVLKGPASALYGRFEPGGVINVATKQPFDRLAARLSGTFDGDGTRRGALDVNAPLAAGLALRVNAVLEESDSFRDFNENSTRFVAPVLAWQPSDDTKLSLEGEYLKRDGRFDRGFAATAATLALPLSLPPERYLGEPGDAFATTTGSVSARFSHALSEAWSVRLGGAWTRSKSDGAYFFPVGAGAIPLLSSSGVLNRRFQTTFDVERDVSGFAELAGSIDTGTVRHSLLLAVDYDLSTADSVIRRATVNAPLNIFAPSYGAAPAPVTASLVNTDARTRGLGGLVQVETRWAEWLRTTAGVRVDSLNARFTNRDTGVASRQSETEMTPRLGVTLLPAPGWAVYANWGRSFAPEVGTRPLVDNAEPRASQGEQVEAGVRWENADKSLRASLAAFRITKSNIRVAEPAPSLFDRQVGEQRSRGVELDAIGRIADRLLLQVNYSFTDTDVTQDRVLAGRTFAGVPRHAASLWARVDVSDDLAAGFGASLIGERFIDAGNSLRLDDYARFDAMVSWRPAAWVDVQLNVLNLFDTRYFEVGNTANNFYPGQPRVVRGSLTLRY
jgi:iron complex outermembrane recepter protein